MIMSYIQNIISSAFKSNKIQNSTTLERLECLAESDPIRTNEEAEQLLAESIYCLVDALDKESIKFDCTHEKAAFYQMLFVAYQLAIHKPTPLPTRH
ncbi:MAG: hypothetical protein GQ532_16425 [Methylomarinum sp.]|nr:hypothetical protein [Methylomarinum sp.]